MSGTHLVQKEPMGTLLKYIFGGGQKGRLVRKVEELATLLDHIPKLPIKSFCTVFLHSKHP